MTTCIIIDIAMLIMRVGVGSLSVESVAVRENRFFKLSVILLFSQFC